MHELFKLLHVIAAIVWLGGMAFMLLALRPVAVAQMPPPTRLPLLAAVMSRFFVAVWASIAVLLLSGGAMMGAAGMKNLPTGVHLMLAIAVLMMAVFVWLYAGPFRRMQAAVGASNWPLAGQQMARIHPLVVFNFVLGWAAVASVYLVR